jgi:spore germination protein YaaH/peptidoglycan/xylan/chitin deacetylase (PgdA/CDA1 family)
MRGQPLGLLGRCLIVWLGFAALTICTPPSAATAQAQPQTPRELEFQFNYRPAAFEALSRSIGNISLVVPEWFIIDGAGAVRGEVEPRVLDLARAHGVPVMVQVKNLDREQGAFRADWAHDLLTNPEARARAIARFLELSREHGLYGVQLELEGVHISDRDALSGFVREAAEALRREGYRLSVSAIHREEEGAGPNSYTAWMWEHWRGVYDLAALGEAADFVRAVVYAQHTRRTPPGPSQSLPWLERVMRHFVESVPPEKLVLGMGMGASHWFTVANPAIYHIGARSWNRGINRADLQALLDAHQAPPLQWDDHQKMAFSYIERAGVFEWVVSDNDVRAFDAKLDLARELGLRGVSMWVNGDEEPAIWTRFRARPLVDVRAATGSGNVAPTAARAPPFGGIPVLAWHYFVDSPVAGMGPLTDTFQRYEEMLAFLAEHKFTSVFPEEARVQGVGGGRQVILTFDDGRKEHLRAAELLERYGFRGIFFVIPRRTGERSDIYLTGEDLARLARAGHRIAVHGYDHRSLAASGTEAAASVVMAYDSLRQATAAPPSRVEFAFPFGHYTPEVATALAHGYRYLMTVNPGYWDGAATMVPRLLIFGTTGMDVYRDYLLGAAEYAPLLRPLTPDGAVAETFRFQIERGPLPAGIELLAVSPDTAGRNYAAHPVGDALRVEGDTLVLDLRRHRDRYFPADRNVIGYALVDRSGGRLRYLTPGLLQWLEEPASGPRLDP